MAVRYPLVVDTADNNKIKELPSGDSLNLSGNNIVNAVDITASGTLTVANLVVDSSSVTINSNPLATVAFTANYSDLTGKPTLFDGQYNSLTGKPSIPGSIQDLANVGTTSPTDGQALIYDAILGRYEPGNIVSTIDISSKNIEELNDVIFTGDQTNDVLKYSAGGWRNERVDFSELTGTNNVVEQGDTLIGDLKGSVFADDSSLLVDAVNGEIPGYVKIADLKTALQDGAGDYAAFKAWVLANL